MPENHNEDILHDLYIHVVRKLKKYDETKSKKTTYIYNCVKFKIKDIKRKYMLYSKRVTSLDQIMNLNND